MIRLEDYYSTFRSTSYDRSRSESLMMDEKKCVINFDSVVRDICRTYREGQNTASADAVALSGELMLFIEFKNQRLSKVDPSLIRKKAFDTYAVFSVLEEKLEIEKKRKGYVVIYREDDIPSWTRWRSRVMEFGGRMESKAILFGLEKYLTLYSDIWTLTADEFHSSSLYRNIPSGQIPTIV